jgi:hypothetical protein
MRASLIRPEFRDILRRHMSAVICGDCRTVRGKRQAWAAGGLRRERPCYAAAK